MLEVSKLSLFGIRDRTIWVLEVTPLFKCQLIEFLLSLEFDTVEFRWYNIQCDFETTNNVTILLLVARKRNTIQASLLAKERIPFPRKFHPTITHTVSPRSQQNCQTHGWISNGERSPERETRNTENPFTPWDIKMARDRSNCDFC